MQPHEIEAIKELTQALNANTEALASMKKVDVPADRELWDAQKCANYLGIDSARSFSEHTAPLPDFPGSVPIPSIRSNSRLQRRWIAQEVQDWALSNRDKLAAKRKKKSSSM